MSGSPDDPTRSTGGPLELSGKWEPVTHPLETSASRLTLIFLWFTAATVGVGFGLELLEAKGIVRRTDLTLFLILAALPLLGVLFNLVRSWRVWPEFRAMRRGEYLARWAYPPELARLLGLDASADRQRRVKLLFWAPFGVIFGGAVVLGAIGAFAKSNPMLVVAIGLNGLWIGALVGAVVALPAHFLFGVSHHIASNHEPVVIFTRRGFYTPGRFVPVMDFARGRRKVSFEAGKGDAPGQLRFELQHGVPSVKVAERPATLPVLIELPVPPQRFDEARALATHYES